MKRLLVVLVLVLSGCGTHVLEPECYVVPDPFHVPKKIAIVTMVVCP